jgi:hypothetical protein
VDSSIIEATGRQSWDKACWKIKRLVSRRLVRYDRAMKEPDDHLVARELPDDPNDSDALRDQLKGQTTMHAEPPRLEDEGQSGG